MNKIYEQLTEFSEAKDSRWVAKAYREAGYKIASVLNELNDVKGKLEYLCDITKDNGDPAFELRDALCGLGIALASTMVYASEYDAEANDEKPDDGAEAEDEEV